MKKIGLLGCGNIACILCRDEFGSSVVSFFDKEIEKASRLSQQHPGSTAPKTFDIFIDQKHELIIEAASINAVKAYAEIILESGRDLVILSVGSLADEKFRQRLESIARTNNRKIYIPSGAIFGLDNIKVAQISPVDRLLLRTTKAPASLGVEVSEPTLVFSGPAHESIQQFPKNINVAVSLSLAADMEAAVEIWADPTINENRHEIFFEGAFGKASIQIQNLPSPDNPATSYLAALSILALLKNLDNPIQIGT